MHTILNAARYPWADPTAQKMHSVLCELFPTATTAMFVAKKAGIDQLKRLVAEQLSGGYVEADLETSVANGRLFAYLAEHADVSRKEYHDSRVTLTCRIPRRFFQALPMDDLEVHMRTAS